LKLPAFPSDWEIDSAELISETFSSRIWKVEQADRSPAVVKELKPFDDVEDELRGRHFLAWRHGEGAVRLLGFQANMMLLEYAGERHLTAVLDESGDGDATEIAAAVIGKLHSPSHLPSPVELQPLRDRFASLFEKATIDRNAGRESLYVDAAIIAERLLADQRRLHPLHGDLHHDNILHGERGWLAIDPKGVLGDPAFDAANIFYNPLDRDDLCLDPQRIARLAAVFARTLDQDPRCVLDFAIAYGCLSAAWHLGDGNNEDELRELSVAAAIRAVRLSF
jgi:streptomycin 6-kinase